MPEIDVVFNFKVSILSLSIILSDLLSHLPSIFHFAQIAFKHMNKINVLMFRLISNFNTFSRVEVRFFFVLLNNHLIRRELHHGFVEFVSNTSLMFKFVV